MIDPKNIWPLIARTEVSLPGEEDHPIRGTAFLISRTHVLTCAHCIGSTESRTPAITVKLTFSRWPNHKEVSALVDPQLISWEQDAAIICLGQKSSEDISILPLLPNGLVDRAWKSCAHPSLSGGGGMVFEGTVADPEAIAYQKSAIQLKCPQADKSVKGASGGPIVTELGIIGLITKQLLDIQSKPAFDVLHACPLKDIEHLLTAVGVQFSLLPEKPLVTELAQPGIASKLCDRNRQSVQFWNHFKTEIERQPSTPQIYIVHGPQMESHRSLVERFRHTEIKTTARRKWGDQSATLASPQYIVWPNGIDFETGRSMLENKLFKTMSAIGFTPTKCTPAELVKITASAHKIFVLEHEIDAESWNNQTQRLIEWYVNFWHEVGTHIRGISDPVFLVFLHVVYPLAWCKRSFLDLGIFLRYSKRKRISLALTNLRNSQGAPMTRVLDELAPPIRRHIRDWIHEHQLYNNEDDIERAVTKVLTLQDGTLAEHRCMAEVEKELAQIWAEIRSPQIGVTP